MPHSVEQPWGGGVQPAASARPDLVLVDAAADPACVEVVAAIERDRIALAVAEHHVTVVVVAHLVVALHVDPVAVLAIEVVDMVMAAGVVVEVEFIAVVTAIVALVTILVVVVLAALLTLITVLVLTLSATLVRAALLAVVAAGEAAIYEVSVFWGG